MTNELMASGGVCLPVDINYERETLHWDGSKWEFVAVSWAAHDYETFILTFGGNDRPLRNALPRFTVERGGLTFRPVPPPMTRREIIDARKKAVSDRRRARLMRPWRRLKTYLTHDVDRCVHCRKYRADDDWCDDDY